MKQNEYVVIGDIYFTKVDEDKYIITDAELSKLIIKYRTLEMDLERSRDWYNRYTKRTETKIKHYYTLAHTYKVELGRCRRKLQRIYERIRKDALACYVLGIIDCKPNELVDLIKHT